MSQRARGHLPSATKWAIRACFVIAQLKTQRPVQFEITPAVPAPRAEVISQKV